MDNDNADSTRFTIFYIY